MRTKRYKVHLVALTPERALVCKIELDGALSDKGITIPAKRVMYFEGKWTYVDLTENEARKLKL